MKTPAPHFIIVAGEASGDMHAAHLVEEIRRIAPQATFSGLGGEKMSQAGVELYEDMTRLAVVGFVEVLKHLSDFRRLMALILTKIRDKKPDAVILVDYPGFNLRLAAQAKKLGAKIIYYISPQVWAWKEDRVLSIKKNVDRMLVLFPFEKEFYAKRGLTTDFIGHPLLETARATVTKDEFRASHKLSSQHPVVGILPGSRYKEVTQLLPPMLAAGKILSRDIPGLQFVLLKSQTIDNTLISTLLRDCGMTVHTVENDFYNGLNACDVCMVASGTATLETAIFLKPMTVVYKTSFLTWLLARWLIKIPYIGLVNVVAGKKIVPECVQYEATGKNIALALKVFLNNSGKFQETQRELQKVRDTLGEPGAAARAARIIIDAIFSPGPAPSL